MRRTSTLFVALLAALVLLHVGQPHCAGAPGAAATSAAEAHSQEHPHTVHFAESDRAGLPDRAQGDRTLLEFLSTALPTPRQPFPEPETHSRTNQAAGPLTPDQVELTVLRC